MSEDRPAFRVDLSERELMAHRRCAIDGLSLSECAREMGVSKQRVAQLVNAAKLKMGQAGDRPMRLVVAGVDSLLPEVEFFREAARGIKLDPGLVAAIERRFMDARPGDGDPALLRELSDAAAIGLAGDRILRLFDYLDDYAMSKSTAPQIVKMIESLVNLRQLLKGQPTSILAIEDRRKLSEVGQALLAEMERRRNVIDVTPEAVGDA